MWITDDRPSERFHGWTRGNVGEVFPDVISPLSWSLVGPGAEAGWRAAFVGFGALADDDFEPDRHGVIGCFGGYAYLNVTANRLFAHRTPLMGVADIDRLLFGKDADAPPWDPPAGARRPGRSALALRSLLATLGVTATHEVDAAAAAVTAFARGFGPMAAKTDDELFGVLDAVVTRWPALFERHIDISFRAGVSTALVEQLLTRHTSDPSVITTLLGGLGEVASAAPARALWAMGRTVAADPALTAAFDAGPDGLLERLPAGFRAMLDGFLAEHGCRGPNEWDPASRTWGVQPALVLAAIDCMRVADADHDPTATTDRLVAARLSATDAAVAAMPRTVRGRFRKALRAASVLAPARELTKTTAIRAIHPMRLAIDELSRRFGADVTMLSIDELRAAWPDAAGVADVIRTRAGEAAALAALEPPFSFSGPQPDPSTWSRRDAAGAVAAAPGEVLTGIAACPGVARGRARVVLDAGDPRGLGPGDVLIAPLTDPSWTPLFLPAEAVVVNVGAVMSHAVIVSRELGIPAVVSVTDATTRIPDGALIEVDGAAGTVTILESV